MTQLTNGKVNGSSKTGKSKIVKGPQGSGVVAELKQVEFVHPLLEVAHRYIPCSRRTTKGLRLTLLWTWTAEKT